MTVEVLHSDVLVFMMKRQPIQPAQVSSVLYGSMVPSIAKFLLSTPSSLPCPDTVHLRSFRLYTWLFRGYYYGSPAQLLFSSLILTFTTTLSCHSTKVGSDYRLFPCNLGTSWKFLPFHLVDVSIESSQTSKTHISGPENNLLLWTSSFYLWQFPSGTETSWAWEDSDKDLHCGLWRQHWIPVSVSWRQNEGQFYNH